MQSINKDPTRKNNLKRWEKGEHTYDIVEGALLHLKEGQRLGLIMDILKDCTICPLGNATCIASFKIIVSGFHPEKSPKQHEIIICPSGVIEIEECILEATYK